MVEGGDDCCWGCVVTAVVVDDEDVRGKLLLPGTAVVADGFDEATVEAGAVVVGNEESAVEVDKETVTTGVWVTLDIDVAIVLD